MSSSIVVKIIVRYAPFEFSNVPHFPNPMPRKKDRGDCLPIFMEYDDDFPIKHLIDFHECML
jgi:hypothetical protein